MAANSKTIKVSLELTRLQQNLLRVHLTRLVERFNKNSEKNPDVLRSVTWQAHAEAILAVLEQLK